MNPIKKLAVVTVIGVTTMIPVIGIAADSAGAWMTDATASAACNNTGPGVVISGSFTNTEPKDSGKTITVTPTYLGAPMNPASATVQPGDTVTFEQIREDQLSVPTDTEVEYPMVWASGEQGTDTRTAAVNAVDECGGTPSPRSAQVVPNKPGCTDTVVSGNLIVGNGDGQVTVHLFEVNGEVSTDLTPTQPPFDSEGGSVAFTVPTKPGQQHMLQAKQLLGEEWVNVGESATVVSPATDDPNCLDVVPPTAVPTELTAHVECKDEDGLAAFYLHIDSAPEGTVINPVDGSKQLNGDPVNVTASIMDEHGVTTVAQTTTTAVGSCVSTTDTLPFTGDHTGQFGAIGALAVVAGAIVVRKSRRRDEAVAAV